MKRHLVAAFVLTGALVLALQLGPSGSVWSAGVLSKVHQKVTCSGCHDAFDSFATADKCLGCHKQRRLVPAEQFSGAHCASCHREHRGREIDLATAPRKSCALCHDPSLVPLKSREGVGPSGALRPRSFHPYHDAAPPPSLAAGASGSPVAEGAPCLRCHPIDVAAHARKVRAPSAESCVACHVRVHGSDDPAVGPKR